MTYKLNNSLTAMSGYVQVLQGMDADRLLENRGLLGKIFGQTLQCTVTLSRLARFARQSSDGAPMPNLLALVEDTLALKAYELRRGRIDVRVDIAGGIRLPRIDSAHLQQILVNLLDNAIRAMAGADVRTLELQACEQEDSTLLLIRDSGPGIPGAIREKIFDPCFTTGGPEAAGLGLHASIRLLEASGATVSVESEEGRGSAFTLHLPHQGAADTASAAPTKMEPGKG